MKYSALFVIIFIGLIACHQMSGSGNIITEKRNTGEFTGINAGSAFEVELKNGPSTEVIVEADDNIINKIKTRVVNNVLKLDLDGRSSFNNAHLKVFITAPNINLIKSSGAASILITDLLKNTDQLNMEASGASNIKGAVDAPEITTDISGAANITLTGRTKNHKASASGSATLKTGNLMSETTTVEASGAAAAHVYASVHLTAEASGAANIYYNGTEDLTRKTSGAANIKKEN